MSPKPPDKPPRTPYAGQDPRAFSVIPDGRKKKDKKEKRDKAKARRDEMIAKFGHPRTGRNAG